MTHASTASRPRGGGRAGGGLGPLLLTLGVAALTLALRLGCIAETSLTQDESTMVLFAKGVLERGYPFLRQTHAEFLISTYELVPYPIAASLALFGDGELGGRLPSALFSTLTAALIVRFGTRLFDRRVGLFAGLMYAVLPWAIHWGTNAFYPAQVQFFCLLLTMSVHRLIVDPEPRPAVYYAVLGSFALSYLSWEGAGFVLPVLFLLLIACRFGRFEWLTQVHGWLSGSLFILLVVAQLTYRTVLREPYLGIQTGRSQVSGATLAFTAVGYDPYYYVENLHTESHVVIGMSLLLGILLLPDVKSLRFLYGFVTLTVGLLTMFLGYYALRYVYLALPATLLGAAAATVGVVDRLTPGEASDAGARWARRCGLGIGLALHLSVATPFGLKPLELSPSFARLRPYELRYDSLGFSFKTMAQSLATRTNPGDIVIVQAPFPLLAYLGRGGDYYLQEVVASSVFYDRQSLPYYTDKWIGNPVLRTQDELEEVLLEHERVWFVSAPDGASRASVGEDLYQLVERRMQLVLETADGKLFLSERPRPKAE